MRGEADIILVSAPGERSVLTVDPKRAQEEALAICGDKIAAVGATSKVMELKGPRTQVIELGGRTAMPGFIDAHVHFLLYGVNHLGINLKAPNVKSISDIKRLVKERAAALGSGKWVKGWGYNHTELAEGRHPTRFDLDEVSPDNPVILTRTCGHIAVANGKALELAGIDDSVVDPPGGRFGRSGARLDGVLYEAAQDRVLKAGAYTLEEYAEGLKVADRDFLEWGITSVHDEGLAGPLGMRALVEGARSGALHVRVYASVGRFIGDTSGDHYLETGLVTGFGDDRLRIGSYKIMVDGSSSGPTSATREPYASDPEDFGILYYSQNELDALVAKAHSKGFQVTAHCIGDRAIEMMLNSFAKALGTPPKLDCRHRIEHCAICPPDLVSRVKDLGVIPVAQPIFFYEFGGGYISNYGRERVGYMFPMKSFIERGIPVAMSSDSPITTFNPFMNIYEAATRKTKDGQVCGESERVNVMEALCAYTVGGAHAAFEEQKKGSLEAGKVADVIVLSGDIVRMPIEEVKDMRVDLTISGGEIVYAKV